MAEATPLQNEDLIRGSLTPICTDDTDSTTDERDARIKEKQIPPLRYGMEMGMEMGTGCGEWSANERPETLFKIGVIRANRC